MDKTIEYSQRLRKVGFSSKQSEEQIKVLGEMMENHIARVERKIEDLERRIREEFATKSDLQKLSHRIDLLEEKINQRFEQLEMKIVVKLGFLMTLQLGAIAAFFSFMK